MLGRLKGKIMNQLEYDLLKVLELIYMESNKSQIFPYARTIHNILTGNPKSKNASKYRKSPYYGLYKYLTKSQFQRTLDILIPIYIETVPVKKRVRFKLTDESQSLFNDPNIQVNHRHFKNPEIDALFPKFNGLKTFDQAYFDTTFQPEKGVSVIGNNHIGDYTFQSIQRTVAYESGDEKRFLEYLDDNNAILDIKTQSLCIEYPHGKKIKKYYPDFVIYTKDRSIIVVEIKAMTNMSYHMNVRKYDALKDYCNAHGYGYGTIGFTDKFYSYEYLASRPVNPRLETRVKNSLAKKGRYNQNQYAYFKEKYKVHALDIHSIVLKHHYKKLRKFNVVDIKVWDEQKEG